MELSQLQYFQMLCQKKSYTKAAAELNVSQPTVSIAVKKLEAEFDCPLIDKTKTTFALTPMGEALLEKAKVINDELSSIYPEIDALVDICREDTIVILPDCMCGDLMRKIVTEYLPQSNEAPVLFGRKSQRSIINELIEKRIDIGIVCANAVESNPAINTKKYKMVEFYACVPPNDELFEYDELPREALAGRPLLLPPANGILADCIISYFREGGIEPTCSPYLDNDIPLHDACMLAVSRKGIAFLDGCVNGLKCIPLDPPLTVELAIAFAKRAMSPKVIATNKRLIDFIRDKKDD